VLQRLESTLHRTFSKSLGEAHLITMMVLHKERKKSMPRVSKWHKHRLKPLQQKKRTAN